MKMQRTLILFLCTILIGISLSDNVFASNKSNDEKKKFSEIVQQLENYGLSKKDAQYYALLDIKVERWERNGKKFNLDNVQQLSNQYVRSNPTEFRQRVLAGDEAALKKALLSDALKYGSSDIENFFKENTDSQSVEIIYPDGSSVSATVNTVPDVDKEDKEVIPNSNMSGPWNASFSGPINYNAWFSPGNWHSWYEFTTSSGSGYIKIRNNFHWTLHSPCSVNNWESCRATARDSYGAATSFGIATVVNENNVNRHTDTNRSTFLQSYHNAALRATSSFTIGEWFSTTININDYWHQYAIIEVSRVGVVNNYRGYFR